MSDKPPMDPKGKGKFKHATSSNRTSNNWTPDELEKNWETAWNDPKRTSVTSKYDGLQIEFGAMVSNSMKDDKNLFLDNELQWTKKSPFIKSQNITIYIHDDFKKILHVPSKELFW